AAAPIDVGADDRSADAQDASILYLAVVRVLSAKLYVERAGERSFDDASVRAGMPAGVAAYHAERVPGDTPYQWRPGCRCQRGKSRRHPVGQVVPPGRRP